MYTSKNTAVSFDHTWYYQTGWGYELRSPTFAEYGSALDATKRFLTNKLTPVFALQNFVLVSHELTMLSSEFLEGAADWPHIISFRSSFQFENEAPSLLNVMVPMDALDLEPYIKEYLWDIPGGGLFSYTQSAMWEASDLDLNG